MDINNKMDKDYYDQIYLYDRFLLMDVKDEEGLMDVSKFHNETTRLKY